MPCVGGDEASVTQAGKEVAGDAPQENSRKIRLSTITLVCFKLYSISKYVGM